MNTNQCKDGAHTRMMSLIVTGLRLVPCTAGLLRRVDFISALLLILWNTVQELDAREAIRITSYGNYPNENYDELVTVKEPGKIDKCDVNLEVSYKNCKTTEVEDIMVMNLPKFIPTYKNPCYYENLTTWDVYEPMSYYRKETINMKRISREPYFNQLKGIWKERIETEVNPQRVRCLPYLYIAGVQKSGTTDLWAHLKQHPQFLTGTSKENHYWARKRFGTTSSFKIRRFVGDYDKLWQYIDMFDMPGEYLRTHTDQQGKAIIAEGSVATAHENDQWRCSPENRCLQEPAVLTPHYIRHLTPGARIMMILRNPTDRLYSDAQFFSRVGSPGEFHEKVLETIVVFENCTKFQSERSCLYSVKLQKKAQVDLRASLYPIFIADWLAVFPINQFHFIKFEEYSQDRQKELSKIYQFLDIDPFLNPKSYTVERYREDRVPMWIQTRHILDKFFRKYNRRLADLLGDNKWLWRS